MATKEPTAQYKVRDNHKFNGEYAKPDEDYIVELPIREGDSWVKLGRLTKVKPQPRRATAAKKG